MRICIDTVILIDILKDEFRSVQEVFYTALAAGEILVCPVVALSPLGLELTRITSSLSAYWDREAQTLLRRGDHPRLQDRSTSGWSMVRREGKKKETFRQMVPGSTLPLQCQDHIAMAGP